MVGVARGMQGTREARRPRVDDGSRWVAKGAPMPARTEKQRRFMGAELERKREGKKTQTGMSERELEKMASKPKSKKSS